MTEYFWIVANHSQKVLDVAKDSKRVIQFGKKEEGDPFIDSQLWSFDQDGYIYNKQSGLVLDVTDNKFQNLTPIIQFPKHTELPANQKWVYNNVDKTIGLKSNPNLVLDVRSSSKDDGVQIILYQKTPTPNQQFTLLYKDVFVTPLSTEPQFREAVEVLMTDDAYAEQRDLFLRGFAAVQQKDPSDPTSYYQIAGIHGLPYEPYDGVTGSYSKNKQDDYQWGGYCHHGDILFPTWHRPYLMLLEQCIYEEAKKLVQSRNNYNNHEKYVSALQTLRLPYWDWASPSTLAHGVPSFFFQETVTVAMKIFSDGTKEFSQIPNPLRAYTLPRKLGTMSLVGDKGNPTQRPYTPGTQGPPYTPEGFATVRHPNEDYRSQVEATSLDVVRDCSTTFRPNVYQIFLVKDWRTFSNHGWTRDPDQKEENRYGNSASLEVIHDSLHNSIGGSGGHMSHPDVAAFDPIFFLHHCNVDRLFAIWQACHPDVWIIDDAQTSGTFTDKPRETIGAKTPLTPFRKHGGFWNSDNVRDITKIGYNYRTVAEKQDPKDLIERMLGYYHPNRYLQTHWQVQISVKKNQLGYPFSIRVFLDFKNATASTSRSSPNYAGEIYIFARGKDTPCENCIRNAELVVIGAVDLTLSMQRLGLLQNRKTLEGDRVTLVAVRPDGNGIPLKEVGLQSAAIYMITAEGINFQYTFVNNVIIPSA